MKILSMLKHALVETLWGVAMVALGIYGLFDAAAPKVEASAIHAAVSSPFGGLVLPVMAVVGVVCGIVALAHAHSRAP